MSHNDLVNYIFGINSGINLKTPNQSRTSNDHFDVFVVKIDVQFIELCGNLKRCIFFMVNFSKQQYDTVRVISEEQSFDNDEATGTLRMY